MLCVFTLSNLFQFIPKARFLVYKKAFETYVSIYAFSYHYGILLRDYGLWFPFVPSMDWVFRLDLHTHLDKMISAFSCPDSIGLTYYKLDFSLDPEQKEELVSIIDKLLSDKAPLVVGSAAMAFSEVCPDRMTLIHRSYRYITILFLY